MLDTHKVQYDKYWLYLLNDKYNYQWSHEDQDKVVNHLDGNMDLNFLHIVLGFKLKEIMGLQNDFQLQNFRPQLLKVILYLNAACKSETLLLYNDANPINWQSFYNIIDNSDMYQLQNMVQQLN